MKTVICAIAKNEGKYIEDFCQYHLALGFDEIHIYDNGTEIPFNEERVIVHPFRNVNRMPQLKAYRDFLKNVDYDWASFIDIDEFITLDGYSNIKEYLGTFPETVDQVRIYEKVYGDDEKITPDDIDVPVYDRIIIPKNLRSVRGKSIIRNRNGWRILDPHRILLDKKMIDAFSDGRIAERNTPPLILNVDSDTYDGCYLRHYHTKTLSEFCEQKLGLSDVFYDGAVRGINYFFAINKKTPEKLAYLNSKGIDA